ncbi:DUF4321 domain-containing protein [Intestinibacillus massiliensis]|uniref:DUF4321 domain-containing protein n=1 Tax=Intestinibacillus massiliensis TaxID=1871029 RepID=UPI000B35D509|nr:DUF4321 domain-containing protein [Intestinibacillus massiliensis]
MTKKLSFMQVLILLIGAVLGGFIAKLTAGIPFLSWLGFGDSFGISPFTLDLGVLQLTFGLSIEITVATILGLVAAVIICKWIN